MSLRLLNIALGCAVGLILAGAAQAQPRIQPPGQQPAQPGAPAQPPAAGGLIKGTNPELSAKALQAAGYQDVEIITIENNKQVRGKINNVTMLVLHYGCENNACTSATFYTSFGQQQQIDINWVNAWNTEKRFAKMYIDKNSAVSFDMDIHFFGGTTPDYMTQSAVLFGHMLKLLFEFQPKK